MSEELNIEWLRLSDLEVEPKNPKNHDIEKIMLSIERFGFVTPFIKNYKTGKLLAGHGRKKALELMQKKQLSLPDHLKEDKDGEWLVPVVSGVNIENEQDAMAYLIADNRLEELGGWNTPELLEAIGMIEDSTGDLSDLGISNKDMNDMFEDTETSLEFEQPEYEEPGEREDNKYFDIMFDTEHEQQVFYKFLDFLRVMEHGDTHAERLDSHIKKLIYGEEE
tara:strand:- start:1356 stop:2021 length:666 start_codon:yes stop_codon:yes gene_type:complete